MWRCVDGICFDGKKSGEIVEFGLFKSINGDVVCSGLT